MNLRMLQANLRRLKIDIRLCTSNNGVLHHFYNYVYGVIRYTMSTFFWPLQYATLLFLTHTIRIYNSYTANRNCILNQPHAGWRVPGSLKSFWCGYLCVYVFMCVSTPEAISKVFKII